jgi:hypothetical protein
VEGTVAEVAEVAEGAINCQISIFVISPLVMRSLARAENTGGGYQEIAQALTPVEGMGKRIIVESFSCVSSCTQSGRHFGWLIET